jgi:glycosyltransferase involved in cell wall biosynthesis
MINRDLKVALVFENLFSWGGAAVVNKHLLEIFPNADIYALFGTQEFANKHFGGRIVEFSFLNRYPFIKKLYTYQLPLWPVAIESFNLLDYDLVISSSHSVAKGCITSEQSVHISYIHTPMRYLWDQKDVYRKHKFFKAPFLNYLRMWDVSSADRPDYIISNSEFVSKRCERYWGRKADEVINPPVELYKGQVIPFAEREDYFVVGAPFAENKGGEFVITCAKEIGFNLKVIGKSRGYRRLKRLGRGLDNIEFVGKINDVDKWEILSRARGYLATGIEDFGIFPIEAISCATPVLALREGGYKESIKEGINGVFYEKNSLDYFKEGLNKLSEEKWDLERVKESSIKYSTKRFVREVEEYVRKSI